MTGKSLRQDLRAEAAATGRSRYARRPLGHTVPITLKVHPDLAAHLENQAGAHYCSVAEYVRQLVIADYRRKGDDDSD